MAFPSSNGAGVLPCVCGVSPFSLPAKNGSFELCVPQKISLTSRILCRELTPSPWQSEADGFSLFLQAGRHFCWWLLHLWWPWDRPSQEPRTCLPRKMNLGFSFSHLCRQRGLHSPPKPALANLASNPSMLSIPFVHLLTPSLHAQGTPSLPGHLLQLASHPWSPPKRSSLKQSCLLLRNLFHPAL